MGLTTPELDLLREALTENPGDPIYLQVAAELIQRTRWTEAVDVLSRGVRYAPEYEDAWALLVDAAYYDAQYDRALWAIDHIQPDPAESPHLARRAVQCLERLGRLEAAREAVRAYLAIHPEDEDVQEIKQRLTSAGPAPHLAALDPFYDIERAEHYVAIGRPDRAFRVLRRVQFRNPGDDWLAARLRELRHGAIDYVEDDLSEDLGPLVDPPELNVPSPALGAVPEAEPIEELGDAFLSDLSADSSDEPYEDPFGEEATVLAHPNDLEQETQPDLLPPGARAQLLAASGRAGSHARAHKELEEDDTEEVEVLSPGQLEAPPDRDADDGFDDGDGDPDYTPTIVVTGDIQEYLRRGAERRKRRSLIKS